MSRRVFGKAYKPVYDAALAIPPDAPTLSPSATNAATVKVESCEAKIIIKFKATATRDAGACRAIIGFKVIMADGSWWLYHYKASTWTRHDGHSKDSFGSTKKLIATMGHCKPLIATLLAELRVWVPDTKY